MPEVSAGACALGRGCRLLKSIGALSTRTLQGFPNTVQEKHGYRNPFIFKKSDCVQRRMCPPRHKKLPVVFYCQMDFPNQSAFESYRQLGEQAWDSHQEGLLQWGETRRLHWHQEKKQTGPRPCAEGAFKHFTCVCW